MIRRAIQILCGRERGQTLIFTAVLGSALMGVMGAAVEGGRAFVEFRKMQAAADMAAIVGSQSLPCSTTDSSCISTAETSACTYAQKNGGFSCTAGGSSAPWSSVPPKSCSPYNFIDYGNGATNSKCTSATAPPFYDYVEVSLTDSLGTVPIFNIPVTLSAHAVAKHGIGVPGDYALIELSPATPLSMSGSNTTVVEGSVFANGGITGDSSSLACGGGWYSAGSISGVSTNNSGSITYSPPGCSGSNDSTANTRSSLPQVSDPYSGSSAPPTQPAGSSFPNCSECSQNGYWLDLSSGTWYQGGSVSGSDVELFPGIYSSFSLSNGGQAYFNPGVYTFTSSFDTNHGTMCVYGAADCLNNTCATTQWTTGSAQGDQWYYSCSQWGFWDSCTTICNRPSGLPTTGPTWYDTSTGSASSTPLNGVTIYLPSSASGLTEHGNGGKDGGQYLAAPNPCPGTGTYTSSSVSFPAGAAAATFNYTGLLAAQHGLPANLTSLMTYPSQDLSLLGECSQSQTLEVWPGEMTKPQHLHFLWYDLSSSENYLTGASGQDWYGIFYSPNANFKLRGAGKGAGGPPWITGQVVTDTVDWSGNSYADITYRPCGPGSTPCGSGTGSQLIQ